MALSPNSPQLLLRSPRIAQRVFGLDNPGQLVRSVPRTKFMFKVEFDLSAGGADMLNQVNLNSPYNPESIAFKVKQIDKPRVNLTTVELNQYNKKKLIYTKTDYNDASIKIYDTVDNSLLSLWVNYFTYYVGDSRKKDDDAYSQSAVNSEFLDETGWGIRPLSEVPQFFNSITVYAFFAQTYTSFRYINPRITSIDWQQKDYTSSDPEEVTVNFKYEAIVYEAFGEPSSDIDTGFIESDMIDIPGPPLSLPTQLKPRLFNNQIATFNQQEQLTSSIDLPSNNVYSNQLSTYPQPAVAPGSAVPTQLLTAAITSGASTLAGGNPYVGAGVGMVFNQLLYNQGLLFG